MDYKMLGKRLKEIRKMRNMSQQDLSYEIEYSIPHISHVENGSTKASLDFIVKAANALHTTTDHLLCDSLEDPGGIYRSEQDRAGGHPGICRYGDYYGDIRSPEYGGRECGKDPQRV